MGRLNKPAIPGYKYKSPNQTNANDLVPHPEEDVIASQRADIERIRKGLNTDQIENSANRRRSQEAGGRATVRSLNRLTPASILFEYGKKLGEKIDEENPGAGKFVDKMIDKSGLGKAIEEASVPRGRVELTDEAKERIQKRDDERARGETAALRELSDSAFRGERYKKGGMVGSASKRADGIAQRGKTRGRMR